MFRKIDVFFWCRSALDWSRWIDCSKMIYQHYLQNFIGKWNTMHGFMLTSPIISVEGATIEKLLNRVSCWIHRQFLLGVFPTSSHKISGGDRRAMVKDESSSFCLFKSWVESWESCDWKWLVGIWEVECSLYNLVPCSYWSSLSNYPCVIPLIYSALSFFFRRYKAIYKTILNYWIRRRE